MISSSKRFFVDKISFSLRGQLLCFLTLVLVQVVLDCSVLGAVVSFFSSSVVTVPPAGLTPAALCGEQVSFPSECVQGWRRGRS